MSQLPNNVSKPEENVGTMDKNWEACLKGLPINHASTLKLQMQHRIPYRIPIDIVQKVDEINIEESDKRPTFEPSNISCSLCGSTLNDAVYPQGCDSSNGNGILLIHKHPYLKINIKVKKCSNKECSAINQVFPYNIGMVLFSLIPSCF